MSYTLPLLAVRGVTFGAPTLLFVLLSIACIALAVIVYRQTLPPVGTLRRRSLAAIRALALLIVLFLIFEPVLLWLDRRDQHAQVLLLVDRSASMAVADNGVVRDSVVKNLLRRSEWQDLLKRASLREFAFGDSAVSSPLDSILASSADLVGSNPADAWLEAARATAGEDVGAIVLITDGAQNSGPNPERVAVESDVPIYTIGVGDTTLRRDALIADILTNDIAYKGAQVPVRVRVRGQGLSGANGRLRLVDSRSRTLLDEPLKFDGSLYEKTLEASFQADVEGELRLTAILDSIPGELATENNRRSRVVRILDSKYNVVLLAGAPSPDVTILMQALGQDTTVAVTALVETRNGFVGGKSANAELLNNADMFALVNYPTSATNRQVWDAVAARLVSDGVPLLWVSGSAVSPSASEKIDDRLPFDMAPQSLADRVIVRDGASHSAISARGPLAVNWAQLPPVSGAVGKITAKPAATVVATFANELTPELPGGPALLISDMNRRRTAAFTVHDIYRWALGRAKESAGNDFYSDLTARLTAWLLAPTEEKQVRITTDKKVYSSGEPVRLQAQVYGADLQPLDDAGVLVTVAQNEQTETIALRAKGNGLYEGQFTATTAGDFTYGGFAVARGDTIGKDRGAFVVESFNLEWLDSRARFDVLQAVSRNSGGQFFSANQPDSLFEKLALPTRVIESQHEISLWNRPLFLWILIGLLGLEWLLRKRSGML